MILNERLDFSQLNVNEQTSFRSTPAPELVRFAEGHKFYKWTSYPLVTIPSEGPRKGMLTISSYWSTKDALTTPRGSKLPSFEELRKRYANKDGQVGAPRDWARARAAVTKEWNSMESITFMQLDQVAWGFVGIAAAQRESKATENVLWIGGDWQIVIPGLQPEHCHRIG